MVDQALAIANRGWRVLPLAGKVPILKEWPTLATTNHETIRAWWTKYPTANIGIATGKESNLFVLDVDPAKGGDESLRALEAQFGALPQTIEVVTGGGGRHIYFAHPGLPIGNSASQLGPGLDIKTDGGQVVAPPSIHPDTHRFYAWEASHHPDDGIVPAEAPPWLLQALTAVSATNGQPFTSPERILDGERNDKLYRLGRSLKAKGLSREAILAALQAENLAKCDHPGAAAHIDAIARHVWEQSDSAAFTQNGHAPQTTAPGPQPDEAEPDALKSHDLDELELTHGAGLYVVHSAKHEVRFTFDRVADAHGGVGAELTVTEGTTDLLSCVDVGLKSHAGHTALAKDLVALTPSVPWKQLLQRACSLVLTRHREGEPIIVLQPSTPHVPFLINPFVYQQHPSLIYAPGGSLKSYLALYLALLACHGGAQHGVAALRVPVLYLDWELNAQTVGGRLTQLRTGHPELAEYVPYYRRCEYPLHQEVHQIARYVAEHHIELLILDSAVMACGGEMNGPDTVVKLTRALRIIGCASLLLAHVAKLTPEGQERTAFGSVYFRELARNVWDLTKADGDGPPALLLKHNKNNFGPLHAPIGFTFTFAGDAVSVSASDPAAKPEFNPKPPAAAQIRNLLEDGEPRSSKEIAVALGMKPASVKATLSAHRGTKWHMIGENRGAKWTVLNR
jgi:hypothetical protein